MRSTRILLLLTLLAAFGAAPPITQPPNTGINTPPQADSPTINLRRTVTVDVVKQTKDAVVNISATTLVNRRVHTPGPFWQPFDFGQIVQVPESSLGSGFIIHPDGYVVTNNHVIDRAREISVELSNGHKFNAELISTDPDADLAVLHIKSDTPLPVMNLGESDDLMIGEPVIAIGNPLGFSHTVSTGIVSALHRDIDPTRQQEQAGQNQNQNQPLTGEAAALRDLIQTDAAINPGNSGGPLLNAYGEVIGIDTAIRSDAQNIGFAIPIDRLRNLIPDLMNPAGVNKVDVPIKLTEQRTMIEPATVVADVVTATADHRKVVAINGQHPQNIIDAYADLLHVKVGGPVTVKFTDGQEEQLVTKAAPSPDAVVATKAKLGLTIVPVSPMLADKYQLAVESGLLITNVARDGAGAKAGLEPGDVLVQLGRYPVANLKDIGGLLPTLPAHNPVHIIVVRGNDVLQGALQP